MTSLVDQLDSWAKTPYPAYAEAATCVALIPRAVQRRAPLFTLTMLPTISLALTYSGQIFKAGDWITGSGTCFAWSVSYLSIFSYSAVKQRSPISLGACALFAAVGGNYMATYLNLYRSEASEKADVVVS